MVNPCGIQSCMSIKSFFNGLAIKREEKRKYLALIAAIKAEDIDGVRKALADGGNAAYLPGSSHKKIPMNIALQQGNAAIFEELLNTEHGTSAAYTWYTDFRVLKRAQDFNNTVYFTPSYLYSAIEQGKEDIALILARKKGVDFERSGDIFMGGGDSYRWETRKKYMYLVKSPIDLAREKGMVKVVEAIEERLKPLLAIRAEAEAVELAKKAEEKTHGGREIAAGGRGAQPQDPPACPAETRQAPRLILNAC